MMDEITCPCCQSTEITESTDILTGETTSMWCKECYCSWKPRNRKPDQRTEAIYRECERLRERYNRISKTLLFTEQLACAMEESLADMCVLVNIYAPKQYRERAEKALKRLDAYRERNKE